VIAALLAVALYVAAFPPLDAGPLAFVALAPWCWIARRWRGGRLFLAGSLVGAGILAIGCFWIRRTHPLNLAFMVVPESLFFGGFALLLRAIHVTRRWPALVALPLAFTAIEFVRGRWPLDGFPWLTFGYTQHRWLEIVQVSALAGVHGVTFLLALVAGALCDAWPGEKGRRRIVGVAVAAGAVGAAAIGGHAALGDPAALARGPRLLLVQPNFEQNLKDDPASWDRILARHFELEDAALAREKADLVVWSETIVPVPWPSEGDDHESDDPRLVERRAAVRVALKQGLFGRHRLPLLAGAATYEATASEPLPRLFNSVLLFDAAGRRVATYDKRVLVPGGEYLPWIDRFPDALAEWIRGRVLEMAGFPPDLSRGTRSGVVDLSSVGSRGRAGMTVCYEMVYPDLGRDLVKGGADLLVNLSNEGWFHETSEFEQFSAIAAFRAAETRRSLVRCANTGTSGWFDPWGRPHLFVVAGATDGVAGALVVEPPLSTVVTPYVRFGEWVGAGAAIAALLALVRRRRGSKSRPESVTAAARST